MRCALRIGTAMLGHGFTGRLMGTVRDKQGLTYGIDAAVSEDTIADGAWDISASFAPALLEKGLASTQRRAAELVARRRHGHGARGAQAGHHRRLSGGPVDHGRGWRARFSPPCSAAMTSTGWTGTRRRSKR